MTENDKTLELEAGGFEILAADPPADGTPALPKFRMVAYTGATMKLGYWGNPVIVDVAGISIPSQKIPIRFGHDPSSGVGHTTSLEVVDGKLIAEGVVSRDTPEAREVVASAKNGFPWQISIGASANETEMLREGENSEINGKKVKGPLDLVRKATLGEISFVDLGADRKTKATIAAKAAEEIAMPEDGKTEVEKKVEAGKAETTPTEKKVEAKVISRSNDEADRLVADAYRRKAINAMTVASMAEYPDSPDALERIRDLGEEHIKAGTSAKDFELVLLRERPVINGRRSSIEDRSTSDVLSAAAMISGLGDETAVKVHGERHVEAARKKFGHDIGLQEIMLQAAKANGYHGRDRVTVGNWREVWGYAVGDIRASGFSTVNLPNILGNVANKAIGKVAGEPGWLAPVIAGKASHSNFFSHTVLSMGINGSMDSVGPGGELKHQRLSEEYYSRQVGTRGAVLRLSRTDIINDDMGVFSQNAAALVRKAFNAREKALFTLIIASGAGSSHFTAARTNYISGGTTVPGTITGMNAAVKAFRKLTGADGEPVGIEPAIVICSPTYEADMNSLLGTPNPPLIVTTPITATTAFTRTPSLNIYSGRFGGRALVSPWLENTSVGGADSSTIWYLFADPNILPCYEVAYLNGQEQPTVEYFGLESEADTLGVAWRIYWDFGVAAANWRAGVKVAGA